MVEQLVYFVLISKAAYIHRRIVNIERRQSSYLFPNSSMQMLA
ncbi:hypothetical protein N500_0594 [Wolbachia pipientis wUni]|nr:hypothetical protein N500_0594 [Wolbachia pipientis wUni]